MISNNTAEQLNGQLNNELFSAYYYLGLSAQADRLGLAGIAAWFMAKHNEEQGHAMKLYRYILDQGARVSLQPIDGPPAEFDGVLDMFERTLEHEQDVTRSINNLVDAALAEKDHATSIFLHWYVTEQIEEESVVNDIIARLRLVGAHGEGLFMIDKEMAGLAAKIVQAAAATPA